MLFIPLLAMGYHVGQTLQLGNERTWRGLKVGIPLLLLSEV